MALSEEDSTDFATAAQYILPFNAKVGANAILAMYWYDSGSTLYRRAKNISQSGGSLAEGSTDELTENTIAFAVGHCGVETGKALVITNDNDTSDTRAGIVTNTPTFGSTAQLDSSAHLGGRDFICANSGGTIGLAGYIDGSTRTLCRFTISGSTITAGTPQAHSASPDLEFIAACAVDSDRVAILYQDTSAGEWAIQVIDISSGISEGTPAPLGLDYESYSTIRNPYGIAASSGTKLVAVLPRAGNTFDLVAVTISGTSVTSIGTEEDLGVAGTGGSSVDVSGDNGVIAYQGDGTHQYIQTFSLSGLAITLGGDELDLDSGVASQVSDIYLVDSGARAILVYEPSTGVGRASLIGGLSGGGGGAGPYDLVHSLAGIPGGILVS